jgi:hypothetical protein
MDNRAIQFKIPGWGFLRYYFPEIEDNNIFTSSRCMVLTLLSVGEFLQGRKWLLG